LFFVCVATPAIIADAPFIGLSIRLGAEPDSRNILTDRQPTATKTKLLRHYYRLARGMGACFETSVPIFARTRPTPHNALHTQAKIGRMNDPTYPLVYRHPANQAGRDFVVGDLHGCVDALRYLLREIDFDAERDRLFSVGDLIDRGTDSLAAIDLIDKPWFYPVLGNHEDSLIAVATGAMRRHAWYAIGGAWAETLHDDQLGELAVRLSALPLVRVVGEGAQRFNILHAEFFGSDADLDAAAYSDETRNQLLWGRGLALGSADPKRQQGLSPTYCGHTPTRTVKQIGAQIYIDTGAFASEGRLTIVQAGTDQRWSVKERWAASEGARELALP
jgi:serine/threonine protein phosphatase 1